MTMEQRSCQIIWSILKEQSLPWLHANQRKKKMTNFTFPLRQRPDYPYHTGGRRFGANRNSGSRRHAGCDLVVPRGMEILAMADGRIVREPYHFYSGSYALEIEHSNGKVVRYGEIMKIVPAGIRVGARVSQGEVIARVGQLQSGSSMLHLELYSGTDMGRLTQAGNKYKRRNDLTDPTSYLDAAPLLSELDRAVPGKSTASSARCGKVIENYPAISISAANPRLKHPSCSNWFAAQSA